MRIASLAQLSSNVPDPTGGVAANRRQSSIFGSKPFKSRTLPVGRQIDRETRLTTCTKRQLPLA